MNNNNHTFRIVLADDHDFFRHGFKRIIQKLYNDEVDFVAEACNGSELIECVKEHRPNIVITDIKMPGMDGIEATRTIKLNFPQTKVIALSMFEETKYIMSMCQAGATGYLTKSSSSEEVIAAVRTVDSGNTYYCSSISEKMFLGNNAVTKTNSRKEKKINFSHQETKVIQLICKQLTTKEIATSLNLCTRTVEDYRHNIQEKIGARNVVGIALYALINEIVKFSELY